MTCSKVNLTFYLLKDTEKMVNEQRAHTSIPNLTLGVTVLDVTYPESYFRCYCT